MYKYVFIYGSTNEEKHLCPCHHWLCQFGDEGNGTSCGNEFKLQPCKLKDYKGTCFYDGRVCSHDQSGSLTVRKMMPLVSHLRSGTRQKVC